MCHGHQRTPETHYPCIHGGVCYAGDMGFICPLVSVTVSHDHCSVMNTEKVFVYAYPCRSVTTQKDYA